MCGKIAYMLIATSCLASASVVWSQEQASESENIVELFAAPQRIEKWQARDRQGADVSLDRLRGRAFVAILFRGHGCYRCVSQLTKFAEEEAAFRERGVRIVAITNESVESMDAALGAAPQPFPVLSDARSKLATSLNRESIEDWHGVLIVDRLGKSRWLASGSKPLMNVRQVLEAIDDLRLGQDALKSHSLP